MPEGYIATLQNGRPGPGRVLSATTATLRDVYRFEARRMARIFADAVACHYAFAPDHLQDGLFSDPAKWEDSAGAPGLVEGNILRYRGPWTPLGPTGRADITLNGTSPVAGQDWDAKMDLGDQDTQLFQLGKLGHYLKDQKLELNFNHMESAGVITIDYAIIREGIGEALNYWDGVSAFATAANWITVANSTTDAAVQDVFTCDVTARYGVIFRPTSNQVGQSQIGRVFFAPQAENNGPELPNGIQEYVLTTGPGHFAFKMDAGTASVTICEMFAS